MFEPTIKYRRVNDPPKDITQSLKELNIDNVKKDDVAVESTNKVKEQENKAAEQQQEKENKPTTDTKIEAETTPVTTEEKRDSNSVKTEPDYTFEEEDEDEFSIEIDPNDKERIIVTLSTGKQFSADRYCPHAGADLSYHGKVSEHDYPPEIGPILMCPIHYWEFALEKDGKGGGGWATINACPVEVAEKCAASPEKKKLEW